MVPSKSTASRSGATAGEGTNDVATMIRVQEQQQ